MIIMIIKMGLPVERIVEHREYSGQEVWVKVVKIVTDVLQDSEHYVQAGIGLFSLGWICQNCFKYSPG